MLSSSSSLSPLCGPTWTLCFNVSISSLTSMTSSCNLEIELLFVETFLATFCTSQYKFLRLLSNWGKISPTSFSSRATSCIPFDNSSKSSQITSIVFLRSSLWFRNLLKAATSSNIVDTYSDKFLDSSSICCFSVVMSDLFALLCSWT